MLNGTGRYLLIYLVLVAGMALMFIRLPSSFLPEEDQGVFLAMVQLPPGSTQEQTQAVLMKLTLTSIPKKNVTLSLSLPLVDSVSRVKAKTWVSHSWF